MSVRIYLAIYVLHCVDLLYTHLSYGHGLTWYRNNTLLVIIILICIHFCLYIKTVVFGSTRMKSFLINAFSTHPPYNN